MLIVYSYNNYTTCICHNPISALIKVLCKCTLCYRPIEFTHYGPDIPSLIIVSHKWKITPDLHKQYRYKNLMFVFMQRISVKVVELTYQIITNKKTMFSKCSSFFSFSKSTIQSSGDLAILSEYNWYSEIIKDLTSKELLWDMQCLSSHAKPFYVISKLLHDRQSLGSLRYISLW